jgi:hypothetical protein
MPNSEQETLYRLSMSMVPELKEKGALPTSKMCVRCKFFDAFRYLHSVTPHHCHRIVRPFANHQLRIDCSLFEAGDTEKQVVLWERFQN